MKGKKRLRGGREEWLNVDEWQARVLLSLFSTTNPEKPEESRRRCRRRRARLAPTNKG
jgi:hypothetical protein